jgi:hypothetical protein
MDLLGAIVKGAEFLENPLIKPDQYQKGMQRYDQYCEWARAYQREDPQHQPIDGQRNQSA